MISLFRIDERLIHGQIAIKWSKHLSVTHIIVANDKAANNKLMANSLKMAAPASMKTSISTIENAIKLLSDPRIKDLKVLVLVDSPKDALTVASQVAEIKSVNVGNYGRVAKENPGLKRSMYTLNVYLDETERKDFEDLVATGLDVYYQTIPEDAPEKFETILKEK